jgi:hypothetical protein
VAYTPLKRTVIRSGFGIFFAKEPVKFEPPLPLALPIHRLAERLGCPGMIAAAGGT